MYGKAVCTAMNILFMLILLLAFLLSTPPIGLGATEPELGLDASQLVSVEDTTLEQTRGRYFDLFFSISFTGYWRHDAPSPGLPGARLVYNFGMGLQQQKGDIALVVTGDDASPSLPDVPTPIVGLPAAPLPTPPPEETPVEFLPTPPPDELPADPPETPMVITKIEQPEQPGGDKETLAVIRGGFSGSSGAFQITQVPGSDNVVTSGMAINLWMLNVQETATAERVRSALTEMLGMTR